MNITLNIILESLGLETTGGAGKKEFDRVILYTGQADPLRKDNLYVGTYEEAEEKCIGNSDVYFVCPGCDKHDGAEFKNLFCVPDVYEPVLLFQKIYDEFYRIDEWNRSMHRSLLNQKGLADLLRLSEPVLNNSIHITDSAFSLVACTKGIVPEDDITRSLHEKGYHDEKYVGMLGGSQITSTWAQFSEIGVMEEPNICKTPMVYKIHKFDYTYYNHTVMICDHTPLSPGLIDLFSMLVENLSIAIEANWKNERIDEGRRDKLFGALIDDAVCNVRAVETLAANAGIPLNGNYLFMVVRPKPLSNVPIARIARELSELFPNALSAVHNGIPMVLLFDKNSSDLLTDKLRERIEQFAGKYECFCGISEPYGELTETKNAFVQVNLTLRYGTATRSEELGPLAPVLLGNSRILEFSENSLYYMLLSLSDKRLFLLKNTKYGQMVNALVLYEKGKQIPYLSILYTYLSCERNATKTGELLHMHRNNILYHISKIQDIIGVDLEDPHVRFQLLAVCTFYLKTGKNISIK